MKRRVVGSVVTAAAALLAACSTIHLGIGVPIGGVGGVQVGVGSDGRVSGGVVVGRGGVSVGVGGSGELPRSVPASPAASAASAASSRR